MKFKPLDLRALPGLKKPKQRDDRRWHPSELDFAKGVEVSEVEGTLPGELWDLFHPPVEPTDMA